MSIKKAAKIADAFVGDGLRQSTAHELRRKGRSRDFWRWMKLPFEPYTVELPLSKAALDPHVVMESINFVLPSDMLGEMLRQNVMDICVFGPEGHTSLATYWAEESTDFMQKIKLNQADAAFAIPLFLHEDGVPSFQDESYSFWSWSSLSRHQSAYSRAFVVGLPSSRVLPSTRATICDALAWDLANLAKGVRPTHDHRGRLLTGKRAELAGEDICGGYTAHFTWWKGDMEARVSAHNLMTRHYRHLAAPSIEVISGLSDEADQSHWLPVPGYSRSRILLDSMHLLNCIRPDILVDKTLHRFTYRGKEWAKTVGEELNIKDMCLQKIKVLEYHFAYVLSTLWEELTRAKIGMPNKGMVLKKYPELDSRIKAPRKRINYIRRTSKDFAAVLHPHGDRSGHMAEIHQSFCSAPPIEAMLHTSQDNLKEANPNDELSAEQLFLLQMECTMLWALSTTLQIWLQGRRPHLTDVARLEAAV
ncbi:unnamed protein product [Symbiodinium sp. CCMP2592]|nr:unnamed protein product [Symbiodinium sp. CCMP2592]